jgi:hypothetical protein
MNALANGVLIAGLVITSLTVIVRLHSWIFILKTWTGRLEACTDPALHHFQRSLANYTSPCNQWFRR